MGSKDDGICSGAAGRPSWFRLTLLAGGVGLLSGLVRFYVFVAWFVVGSYWVLVLVGIGLLLGVLAAISAPFLPRLRLRRGALTVSVALLSGWALANLTPLSLLAAAFAWWAWARAVSGDQLRSRGGIPWHWALFVAGGLSLAWVAFVGMAAGQFFEDICGGWINPPEGFAPVGSAAIRQRYISWWPPVVQCEFRWSDGTTATMQQAYPSFPIILVGGVAVLFVGVLSVNALARWRSQRSFSRTTA